MFHCSVFFLFFYFIYFINVFLNSICFSLIYCCVLHFFSFPFFRFFPALRLTLEQMVEDGYSIDMSVDDDVVVIDDPLTPQIPIPTRRGRRLKGPKVEVPVGEQWHAVF